jgi:WD40 repeat protein
MKNPSIQQATMANGFISYSHDDAGHRAAALQRGLETLARPWYRRRALRISRDRTDLPPSADLDLAIRQRLLAAEWLIFMASPKAAAAESWSAKEAAFWFANKPADHVIVCLAKGQIAVDASSGQIDWTGTNALPAVMQKHLAVPLYEDLRRFDGPRSPDFKHPLNDPDFRESVRRIAAPLHGVPLAEFESLEKREQRRAIRAFGLLGLLLIAASVFGIKSFVSYREENASALSQGYAADATKLLRTDPEAALRKSVEAYSVQPTAAALSALIAARRATQFVSAFVHSGKDAGFQALAALPESGAIVALGNDKQVRRWSLANTQAESTQAFPFDGIIGAATFLTDGTLVVGDSNGGFHLQAANGKPSAAVLEGTNAWDVGVIAASPDDQTIAVGYRNNHLAIWHRAQNRWVQTCDIRDGHGTNPLTGSQLQALSFTQDGSVLVSAGSDGAVLARRSSDCHALWRHAPGENRAFRSVVVAPKGELVCAGGDYGALTCITGSGGDAHEFDARPWLGPGDSELMGTLAIDPQGLILATGTWGGEILVWNLRDLLPERQERTLSEPVPWALHAHGGAIRAISLLSAQHMVSGDGNGRIIDWDLGMDDVPERRLVLGDSAIESVWPSHEGSIVVADADGKLRLLDRANRKVLRGTQVSKGYQIKSMVLSEQTKQVAIGTDLPGLGESPPQLLVYSWPDLNEIVNLTTPHTFDISALAFAHHGTELISGGMDGRLFRWTLTENPQPQLLTTLPAAVQSVVELPGGALAAVPSSAGSLIIRQTDGKEHPVPVARDQELGFGQLAVAPNGQWLAAGLGSGDIVLWPLANGQTADLQIRAGRGEQINAVAWSSDSQRLIAGDGKGVLTIWSINASQPLLSFDLGGQTAIYSVAYADQNKRILAGTGDGRVIELLIDGDRLLDQARRLLAGDKAVIDGVRK